MPRGPPRRGAEQVCKVPDSEGSRACPEEEVVVVRVMLKVRIPVEAGNTAISSGDLPKVLGSFMEQWKPEAAYFLAEGGERLALFVLDLADPSDIPVLAEPLFQGMNAAIELQPVMNLEEL